jgi:hypothetical protein
MSSMVQQTQGAAMTDEALAPAAETDETPKELKEIAKTTKRGFDLSARLKNRGLRKSTIVLFLDEEKGPELGWAFDNKDIMGNVVSRSREGVIGALDLLSTTEGEPSAAIKKDIAELEKKRDALIADLSKTGITVKLRAVPPIIQKDIRRRAKATLEITEKDVPPDIEEEFNLSQSAHLMTLVFQSITDNETGEVNTEVTYADAVDLIGYLPPGQFQRLDNEMGKVQFMDAISTEIETQEDFS